MMRRSTFIWTFSLVICAILAAWGWISYIYASAQITLSASWADTIVELTDSAIKDTNPTAIANTLEYISRYYRAASPPTESVPLHCHNLLEQIRINCQHQLIQHLRVITDDDLPSDVTVWIMKYADSGHRESHGRRATQN